MNPQSVLTPPGPLSKLVLTGPGALLVASLATACTFKHLQHAGGHTRGPRRPARNRVVGQHGQANQISYFDPRKRSIPLRGHAAVVSRRAPIRPMHDERSAAKECIEYHARFE